MIGFIGLIITIIKCVWGHRGWLEGQFNATRENAHKILEKHEEKDDARHHEIMERQGELERAVAARHDENARRMTAMEVALARLARSGGKFGPEFVAGG